MTRSTQRPFGPTGHDVSVIEQGTWYIDHGDRNARWPPCSAGSTLV